ncbi:MAG: glutamate--tRNA ligase [Fimbriimonadaceae bacterium]|nr:glutamate--tRNA ligase [Fimbriimonadaceae bacterium]QYK58369.1 MAG: glutamate--tRNA ligase [Fimbriimonadaceae bacterium]
MSVRVRFAPSPTGMLHVGALRTVLFNWLFAKKHGGTLILRIEDTDQSRYSPESEQEFVDTLAWAGIEFDEGPHVGGPHGPYRQSERKAAGIYEHHVQRLLASRDAYWAFETPEELAAMREAQEKQGGKSGYFGGAWRDADPERVAVAKSEGRPGVVRLKVPRGQTLTMDDAIRGRLEWDSDQIDDPVLIKADGMPTYHFAAMVDDHLMGVTHVFRGDEWLSSAAKHAALFDAFGWERPVFVHCPVIVGNDGKKLSKRHGATRVLDYASQGFLRDSILNFVALIGWSPGDDREVMSREEMVAAFDLRGLQPSPGKFDIEKLRWMNAVRVRAMAASEVLDNLVALAGEPFAEEYWRTVEPEPGEPDPREVWEGVRILVRAASEDCERAVEAVRLHQERVHTLAELGPACRFFFDPDFPIDAKAAEKWFAEPYASELFQRLAEKMDRLQAVGFDPAPYEAALRSCQEELGLEKFAAVVHPTRVKLSGRTIGPGLFELMAVLGPSEVARRLRK